MSLGSLDGLVWLLLMMGPLLFLQRQLHRQLQGIFLILTRRPAVSLALFSLLFLPGVTLHEASHFLMARLLGVPTGRISLLPRPTKSGKLQLGYVETARTDVVRDALIGTAPLISGGVIVAYIAVFHMNLLPPGEQLLAGQTQLFWQELGRLPGLPDFWLWFYLAFAVSSTMLPSTSDRRAWLPIALVSGVLLLLALLAGAGPWMLANLAPTLNGALRGAAAVFAISAAVHLAVLVPVWPLRVLLSRISGLQLQ
jgi:hypothetical protein